MSRYLPILCLALLHATVDAVAMFIEPLWPDLRRSLGLSQRELFVLLSITSVAPNFSQLLFGWVQDRFGSPFLLWLGPSVAAVCLSILGLATTPVLLGGLLTIGYLAVGSFHPEGAVSASKALAESRTRSLSLFMVGGTAGLALGPALSGNLVRWFGLGSLVWLAIPVVLLILVINLLLRRMSRAVSSPAHVLHAPQAGGRWRCGVFLLAVCSLRVVPNSGLTKALAFLLEARGFEANVIGNMQSLFLLCGSLGMLLVGARFGHGSERWLMIVSPLASIPLLLGLAMPHVPTWMVVALLVPTGVILVGTTPAMVAYAHQLFPRDAGIASALTMGLSWGISGLVVAEMISWIVDRIGRPELLFLAFVPALLAAAVGAVALPKTEQFHASHNEKTVLSNHGRPE